jgi:hypothetical protein
LPEENLFQDFSAKHTEAMGVSRDWLSGNQDVSELSDMSSQYATVVSMG